MLVPTSFNKSQDLLTGLPETPFIQAHFSIRIEFNLKPGFRVKNHLLQAQCASLHCLPLLC